MAGRPTPPSFLRRAAMGLWFCGLAVLGLARVWTKLARTQGAELDAVSWAWLIGSGALGALGVVLVLRALRRT